MQSYRMLRKRHAIAHKIEENEEYDTQKRVK